MWLDLCNYIALFGWKSLDSSMVELVGGAVVSIEGAGGDVGRIGRQLFIGCPP